MMFDAPAMPHHADREALAHALEIRADAFSQLGFNAVEIAAMVRQAVRPSVDEIAAAVHEGRFPEGRTQINYCPFAAECDSGKDYCRRIARELLKQFRISHITPTGDEAAS